MKNRQITDKRIAAYQKALRAEERSLGTEEKYLRDIRALAAWLDGRSVAREALSGWKRHLLDRGYAPVTINSMLSAVNGFLRFHGWEDCRVRFLRIQRRLFREEGRELTRDEYLRLLDTARAAGRERLELLMEAICSTGVRVSEVRYLTVEAAQSGQAVISLKGKIRTVLLPGKLCRKLQKFAGKKKIASGEIFRSEDGSSLSRYQIWKSMKMLCKKADVESSKVFPHNLRHLFAATFYKATRDIVKLADVLGHSCVETTRIYLLTTGKEHARQLERLGLVN